MSRLVGSDAVGAFRDDQQVGTKPSTHRETPPKRTAINAQPFVSVAWILQSPGGDVPKNPFIQAVFLMQNAPIFKRFSGQKENAGKAHPELSGIRHQIRTRFKRKYAGEKLAARGSRPAAVSRTVRRFLDRRPSCPDPNGSRTGNFRVTAAAACANVRPARAGDAMKRLLWLALFGVIAAVSLLTILSATDATATAQTHAPSARTQKHKRHRRKHRKNHHKGHLAPDPYPGASLNEPQP